jgi:hypothetical protein
MVAVYSMALKAKGDRDSIKGLPQTWSKSP